MESFGKRMQREREKRGITLEQIAEATKISSTALRALEEDSFDKLPGGIFKKGFVRAYAHYLGIDEDRAVADFVAVAGDEEQPLPDPPVPRREQLQIVQEPRPVWRPVAGLVLAVAVILAVWKSGPLMRQGAKIWNAAAQSKPVQPESDLGNTPQSAPTGGQTKAAPQARLRTAKSATAENRQKQEDSSPAHESQNQAAPAQDAQKPAEPAKAKAEPAETHVSGKLTARERRAERRARLREARAAARARALQAKAAAHMQQVQAEGKPVQAEEKAEFVVQVRALKDVWIQIIADGQVFSDGLLVPPARKRVRGHKEVVIKTANAAAVEVLFNGESLPPLGGENEVATVTFNSGGVRR